jgi:hypothetical protein
MEALLAFLGGHPKVGEYINALDGQWHVVRTPNYEYLHKYCVHPCDELVMVGATPRPDRPLPIHQVFDVTYRDDSREDKKTIGSHVFVLAFYEYIGF